jgi:hypothetical protein
MTRTVAGLALVAVCSVSAYAQNSVMDSFFRGQEAAQQMYESTARIAIAVERARLERERFEAQQRQSTQQGRATDGFTPATVDAALKSMRTRFSDFDAHIPDMRLLSQVFAMGNSPAFTFERYLEGLYLIAKYSKAQGAAVPKLPPITNAEVVSLKNSGFSDDVIMSKLKASTSALTLDTESLINLKKDGISESVITTMLELDRKGR